MATVTIEPVAWKVRQFEVDPWVLVRDKGSPHNWRYSEPLYTSEALAQARAEGKAEGVRDAAGIADNWLKNWAHDLSGTWVAYIEAKTSGCFGGRRISREDAALYARNFRERAEAVNDTAQAVADAILAALPSPPADGETKPPMDSEALFDWLQEHHKSVGVTPALREMYRQYQEATGSKP